MVLPLFDISEDPNCDKKGVVLNRYEQDSLKMIEELGARGLFGADEIRRVKFVVKDSNNIGSRKLAALPKVYHLLRIVKFLVDVSSGKALASAMKALFSKTFNHRWYNALLSLECDVSTGNLDTLGIGHRRPGSYLSTFQDDALFLHWLGRAFYQGEFPDYLRSVRCFRTAFEKGSWESSRYIGRIYAGVEGVESNMDESISYLCEYYVVERTFRESLTNSPVKRGTKRTGSPITEVSDKKQKMNRQS